MKIRKSPSEWIAEAAKAKLPLELGEEAELQDDRVILGRVRAARRNGELVRTNPMALAQARRDGRRQVTLAKALHDIDVQAERPASRQW